MKSLQATAACSLRHGGKNQEKTAMLTIEQVRKRLNGRHGCGGG
ncbi:hypothetical protein [Sporomusa sphaeroides]